VISGITVMDVSTVDKSSGTKIKERQMLTEPWMGTWAVTVPLKKLKMSIDYTGNVYGSMRLPTMGSTDFDGDGVYEEDKRSKTSPVWSLQNIQLTYNYRQLELYGGVKNLLNWTPNRSTPYLIAGADDPFGPGFDPTYVYGPNQGIRGFLGVRVNVKK
jgi:outer membrane receptor for ferrienterochelin and colicins